MVDPGSRRRERHRTPLAAPTCSGGRAAGPSWPALAGAPTSGAVVSRSDVAALAREAEAARARAWRLRGEGFPRYLVAKAERHANRLQVEAELAALAAQGDQEARVLLARRGAA